MNRESLLQRRNQVRRDALNQPFNTASDVIVALSNLDTGQFILASSTQVLNTSCAIPGTWAVTFRWELVIVPFSSEMVHVVSMLVGSKPAAPNTKLSFMLKQPA